MQQPKKFIGGEEIDRKFLNAVIDAIVQRLTINRGRIQRVGTGIAIQIDQGSGGGGGSAHKFVVVTACNQTTGYVRVNVATGGTCASPTLGNETVTAWGGIESNIRTGNSCLLIHNGGDVE